ncbi:AMP-dependent synthetase/ligase [Enteractinococcus coprophilus]|uniref:Acyl-CoA synthetase n=1 Tax=Enteractinococcus coprophilus TaxID=1027633 RepID=A0A543AFD4_9MICC|nr:AMP-dependent synthetase/ligase [Enteractinococcus coprophilus]TQL71282.1 long-chain acyl-CoA synthetase [Enteractinococcus coprophilus]
MTVDLVAAIFITQKAGPVHVSAPYLTRLDPQTNLTDLVIERLGADPARVVYAVQTTDDVDNLTWREVTAFDFLDQVRQVAKGLIATGVQPGEMVAVMSATSYHWAVIDQALWFAGAVSVPIYETSSPSQIAHILTDSGAGRIFIAGTTPARAVDRAIQTHESLGHIERHKLSEAGLDQLAKAGAGISDDALEAARSVATMDSTATVVYTSGTTGPPKGARISHRNLAEGAVNIVPWAHEIVLNHPTPRLLMFLPLAHILARAVQYFALVAGIQVAHTSDTANVTTVMRAYKPTWLLVVPRVLEKAFTAVLAQAEDATGLRKSLLTDAITVAEQWSRARAAGQMPIGLRIKHAFYDRVVYSKIREVFGGEAKSAISGASALNEKLAHQFTGMGLAIFEGYGLTESTAPASVNVPEHIRLGSVGKLVPGMEAKLSETGELLLRGVVISPGYLSETANADSFDDDGWFATGDLAEIDDDGFISITGRSKDLLVTAGGKNVSPAPLEEVISSCPIVGHAVVVGENKPFVGALISLDTEQLAQWAARRGKVGLTLDQARTDADVQAEIQSYVDLANQSVSQAESVRKVVILPTELSQDTGHVTPAEKLRRASVIKDFDGAMAELYG